MGPLKHTVFLGSAVPTPVCHMTKTSPCPSMLQSWDDGEGCTMSPSGLELTSAHHLEFHVWLGTCFLRGFPFLHYLLWLLYTLSTHVLGKSNMVAVESLVSAQNSNMETLPCSGSSLTWKPFSCLYKGFLGRMSPVAMFPPCFQVLVLSSLGWDAFGTRSIQFISPTPFSFLVVT